MIASFLESWPLFQTTYLAGWCIAFTLGLVGVWVVARDQIFLGAAVSQASTLGIAVALWLGGLGGAHAAEWLASDTTAAAFAVAASVTTALLTARAPTTTRGNESAEARTGWVFLLSASVPVLLLAHSAHGLEEVHRLMFSTILGAARADVWIFGVLGAATAVAVARSHAELRLFAIDPEMAAAVGLRTKLWSIAVAVWLGLAVGLSIRVSGLIYTFGCLVLPALIAKNLVHEIRPLLVLAPFIAVATSVVAFVFAHHLDVPPAHAAVAGLCALLAAAWVVRRYQSS